MSLDDAHDLMPSELVARMPKLYATEEAKDPTVYVKLFTPDSNYAFYLTEYDADQRLGFGLVDGHERELGYISLAELEEIRGPLGLKIERDLSWKPKPLSEVKESLDRPKSKKRKWTDDVSPNQRDPDMEPSR